MFDSKLECEAVVLKAMADMFEEKAEIVQGVCFPIDLGKPA
jgi:hypothetical protein